MGGEGGAPGSSAAKDEGAAEGAQTADCRLLFWYVHFEERLRWAVLGLVVYLALALCIALALYELEAPVELAQVHRKLWSHFSLQSAEAVGDIGQVYGFLAAFAGASAELQAGSGRFWCESRFFESTWDSRLGVPSRQCKSPRLHSLGIPGQPAWNESHRDDLPDAARNGCSDSEEELRTVLGDSAATCAGNPEVYCSAAATAQYCLSTCGYCAPVAYEQVLRFAAGSLTPGPAVAFQTRWAPSACSRFAARHAQLGAIRSRASPASFGSESSAADAPLSCSARSDGRRSETAVATAVPCAWGEPCNTGARKILELSERRSFGGRYVYPEALAEPTGDVARLQAFGWLDAMTESVTVAVMVHSPDSQVYTYLAVEFAINAAGGVTPNVAIQSYREPRSQSAFVVEIVVALAVSLMWLGLIVLKSFSKSKEDPEGSGALPRVDSPGPPSFQARLSVEGVIVALANIFVAALLFRWSGTPWVADLSAQLLRASAPSASTANATGPMVTRAVPEAFFAVAEEVMSTAAWLSGMRTIGYFVLLLLAIPVLRCIAVHPYFRMRAFFTGLIDILHAGLACFPLFLLLAFSAHVALGAEFDLWSTVRGAVVAQLRVVANGEPLADAIEASSRHHALSGRVLCRIYVVILLALAVWVFFLVVPAVIFNGFGLALGRLRKPSRRSKLTEKGAPESYARLPFHDVLDAVVSLYQMPPWSVRRRGLKAVLADACAGDSEGPPLLEMLQEQLPHETAEDLEALLARYSTRCLRGRRAEADALGDGQQDRTLVEAIVGPLRAPDEDVPPFADIPFLDQAAQARLRSTTMEKVYRWLAIGTNTGLTWEELAPALAGSILQEAVVIIGENAASAAKSAPPALTQLELPFPPKGAPATSPLPPSSPPITPTAPPLPGTPIAPDEDGPHGLPVPPQDAVSIAASDESC
eukprot:TRINITY_DN18585_c0_g1_i1.p1 TRINITY_DN18585_c0_g1~~TRINITY_DN18585_c0_g1_i1.p1  ORF type:complete len:980 (-),score=175.97 TRINITY_DN18585_c0_g1_i1:38-2830(-)